MDGWIHPLSRMAAMGRPRVQPSDVPAAHATTRLSEQIFSHASASEAVPRPVTQKAQLRQPARQTPLLPPGKETHNPSYLFVTIIVPGVAP